MPVSFIIGEPGSGKTYKMTEMIRRSAAEGKRVTVIVPEQFSSASEHRLYNSLGISLYNRIYVETFTRIRRNILKKNRGLGGNIPGEAAKTVIMYEVRRRLAAEELKTFGRQIKNPAFTSVCLDIVRELEMNGISAEELKPEMIDDNALSDKLRDICTICRSYGELLTESGFSTAASDGEEIAEAAAKSGFFKDTEIYIDGFKSFTADQLRLIEVMKGQCRVTVCMPTPYTSPNASPVFSSVNETMNDICGEDIPDIIRAGSGINRFSKAPDIGILSCTALRETELEPFSSENIRIAYASDISEEADFVCADISRRVRSGKYSYSDIAVVSRDFENICGALEESFYRYEIPYFIDLPSAAASRPLCIFIMTLLEAASSDKPSAESLLRILKTGFTAVSEDHISELERFYTEHGTEKESFDKSPVCEYSGDIDYNILKEYDKLSLSENFESEISEDSRLAASLLTPAERAEIIRHTVVLPLKDFRENCGNTLASITSALCGLLNGICVFPDETEDTPASRESLRIKKLMDKTLGSISSVPLGEAYNKFTLKEYRDIFGMILSKSKLSAPAQTINCVSAASSDRARLDAPKAVYIMGAAEGLFPFSVSESGIFSEKELEILEASLGLKFNERIFRMAAEENFIAVSCIAAPSEELVITCSFSDIAGASRTPSALTEQTAEAGGITPINISELPPEFFITTPASAYSVYVRNGGNRLAPEKAAAAMKSYAEETGELMLAAESCRNDILSGNYLKNKISEELAGKLYKGKNNAFNISAGRLEDYAKCPFMFFCKKGLGLENIKKHEYSPIIRGNTVHEIMQRVLSHIIAEADEMKISFNERISRYTKEELEREVHTAAEDIFNREFKAKGFESTPMFVRSFYYQEKVITDILLHTQREFAPETSKFRPAEFEFPIGMGSGGMPAACFTVETERGDRSNVSFIGSVDRIDIFTDRSSGKEVKYLRVVDYKTGHKKFDFRTLLEGINMQMLLYLYAVTEEGAKRNKYSEFLPAGVMYAPSYYAESGKSEDGRPVSAAKAEHTALEVVDSGLKMSGFVISDVNIIRAMEYSAEGVYIPQKLNTENAAGYITQKGEEMAEGSKYGSRIYKFANSVSEDALKADMIAAEICEYTVNGSGSAAEIIEKYSIDGSRLAELEGILNDADSSDSGFAPLRDEFLTVCRAFSRFDEDIPNSAVERQELADKFTEKSGREIFPDPACSLTEDEYRNIMDYTENKMKELCSEIISGNADVRPLFSKRPCDSCEYRSVCVNGVPDYRAYKYPDRDAAAKLEAIRKGDDEEK